MNNWERLVWNQRDALIDGLRITVEISALAFGFAVVCGLALCLIRLYVPLLRGLAILLIEFFRSVPILVQLVWVGYVWPEVFGWPGDFYTSAWLALGLQSSGYLAETFRTDIQSIARGHREAGMSLGMSPLLIFSRIEMPQVALSAAPSLINQFTVIVKSSTLVSVISVADLMFQGQRIMNTWFQPIEILTATAALYISFIFLVSLFGKMLADWVRQKYGITT